MRQGQRRETISVGRGQETHSNSHGLGVLTVAYKLASCITINKHIKEI